MTTILASPERIPAASFDRAHWLSHCEGIGGR